ncbi:hypothetical protein CW749_20110 [Vibrio sp. vnigr-6D03]|uniref:type I polyketide synthase n=1 Tax=Vibrio sp. vnigr-6D03 TaxID=2058088 RepID=UPI000C3224E0|nr:type I polyketide synthase [Vibrio sp. vnigr-6D03]PKF77845.1 hypothetical protein CW749_20110 [Vibrio sp. vnigr-6D03]
MTNNVPNDNLSDNLDQIAIIGLSARFPGAKDVDVFWNMLESANDGLVRKTSENDVIKACFSMPERFAFDADFFGFSPNEAALMDPQHRVFLECAWHALENAGYGDRSSDDRTGVYAACGFNDYVLRHVGMRDFSDSAAEMFAMMIGNDKDYLATRVAHLLNLTGPAIVTQSACSSGLLCVHQATQALLQGEVNMALAGAASISVSLEDGYFPDSGGVMSPNATMSPFSQSANGIVGGNGAAVFVLKRLEDALADHDYIYATIAGSAANNDGTARAAFTAPSVSGQSDVLQEALDLSGVSSDDVTYIEAHGTGTPLGDPIETESIRRVYGNRNTHCHVGSVKGNVGHLNAAAGLAGLTKVIGVLERQVIPPTLRLKEYGENPELGMSGTHLSLTPTAVSGETHDFAALSSFGFGGTNVHQILARSPAQKSENQQNQDATIIPLSAKTDVALDTMRNELAEKLASAEYNLSDVSKSLLWGRTAFSERCAIIASDSEEAANKLKNQITVNKTGKSNEAVFVFPGQGTQFVGMGLNLYQNAPTFKATLDEAAELLISQGHEDIRPLIFDSDLNTLSSTENTQVALFAVEYASAQWLIEGGLNPVALLGHSIGEYVAATVAGIFSLKDALTLVAARGRLVASLPNAGMLAINASTEDVKAQLTPDLSLAVVNGANQVVVSGTESALEHFEETAHQQGWRFRRLSVSHGFHSHLLEPILGDFESLFNQISLNEPTIPVYSNLTGDLADPAKISTPQYWREHLRHTVLFADNLEAIERDYPNAQRLAVGPGNIPGALPLMLTAQSQTNDCLTAITQLWVNGAPIETLFNTGSEVWNKVPLPGYPFSKVEHCLPVSKGPASTESSCWTHVPQWHRVHEFKCDEARDTSFIWIDDDEKPLDIKTLSGQLNTLGKSHLVLSWNSNTENTLRQLAQELLPNDNIQSITLVTRNLASIHSEEAQCAEQSIALGILRSLPFEIAKVKAIWLDCNHAPNEQELIRAISASTRHERLQADSLGLRDGVLWRRQITSLSLPNADAGDVITAGKTYIIVGGLGALGRSLARTIAPLGVHLVLVSRNISAELVDSPEQDADLAGIIAAGSTIRLHAANVDDVNAMTALASQLDQEGNKVGGIFNLAGRYVSQTVADTTDTDLGPNHHAKVQGTDALASAFEKHQPEFLAIFGSIITEVSGYGGSDYIASNLYCEMLAQQRSQIPKHVIAWDFWDQVGGLNDNDDLFTSNRKKAISVQKGLSSLWDVLSSGISHAIVTPNSLDLLLQEASDSSTERLTTADAEPSASKESIKIASDQPLLVQFSQLLFTEILGQTEVDPADDFILLGGDSITAVRLLSRLRKITKADIGQADFMSARTPKELADLLTSYPNMERIARTYIKVQTMSSEKRNALQKRL